MRGSLDARQCAGFSQTASRRLQSAEDGTAVSDWVLPHQGK